MVHQTNRLRLQPDGGSARFIGTRQDNHRAHGSFHLNRDSSRMTIGRSAPLPGPTTADCPLAVPGHAHLIGIAGSGMQALADWLLGAGWTVSGSDPRCCQSKRLLSSGAMLFDNQRPEHIPPATQVVFHSAAISADNVELLAARNRGLCVLNYPQVVARVMQDGGLGVAVAGTHGKSTCTAMLADIFVTSGADPSVFCGASWPNGGATGRYGQGPLVLAEACEYRRHFLQLRPFAATILNIEADHFDCFDQPAAVEQAFAEFASLLPPTGILLANQDCAATEHVAAKAACRVVRFGISSAAAWQASGLHSHRGYYQFDVLHEGRPWTSLKLRIPGRHNAYNALAATAMAAELGVDAPCVRLARTISRDSRRIEPHQQDGITLVDDYAHHPTAIRATLAAVRAMYPGQRLWCVFEPHQASRTQRLLDELAASLQNADKIVITNVYRAREESDDTCDLAVRLAHRVARHGVWTLAGRDWDELTDYLASSTQPGDVILTMGAGNIREISDGLHNRLRRLRAA